MQPVWAANAWPPIPMAPSNPAYRRLYRIRLPCFGGDPDSEKPRTNSTRLAWIRLASQGVLVGRAGLRVHGSCGPTVTSSALATSRLLHLPRARCQCVLALHLRCHVWRGHLTMTAPLLSGSIGYWTCRGSDSVRVMPTFI